MKAHAFFVLALSILALAPPIAAASPNALDSANVHFEVPATDLIPMVAAVRASCDVNASGEPIVLLANGTARSTLAASPGPCAIALILFGQEVVLPVFNTTPIGTNSFYLPGISTVSLGIVDLSIDLVTRLNSTSRIASGIANVAPEEIPWSSWGARRILLHGEDGMGSVAESEMNTTFTYTLSLALTVYALSIPVYHVDLVQIGSFAGSPSLVTGVSVDLRPHALLLNAPTAVSYDRATFGWTGTVDSDVDHLELRLTGPSTDVSYVLPATAVRAEVLLRPSTQYVVRIVAIDQAGQAASSEAVEFDSAGAPAPAVIAQGSPAIMWTLVALAVLLGIVGYATGFLRGGKGD